MTGNFKILAKALHAVSAICTVLCIYVKYCNNKAKKEKKIVVMPSSGIFEYLGRLVWKFFLVLFFWSTHELKILVHFPLFSYRGPASFHRLTPNKRFEPVFSTVIMAVCSLFNRMLLLTDLIPVHLLYCGQTVMIGCNHTSFEWTRAVRHIYGIIRHMQGLYKKKKRKKKGEKHQIWQKLDAFPTVIFFFFFLNFIFGDPCNVTM